MSRTSSYIHTFHLPVEPRAVFELFANPQYLDLLTPSWFRLRPLSEVSGNLEVGAEISYKLRWRGLPFRWVSLVTDWQAPEYFAYEQKKGPYSFFRHEHFFKSIEGGTEVCDRILFRASGGNLVDRLVALPDLRRILDCRERRALSTLRILQPRSRLNGRTRIADHGALLATVNSSRHTRPRAPVSRSRSVGGGGRQADR